MALANNAVLNQTHSSLLGPARRLAMSREGRMRASCEQALRIRDALAGDR